MKTKLHNGDCLEVLRGLAANSLDSLVTDPPAGIAFMGKDWDKDKGGRDAWVSWMTEVMRECLRVLKPGAHGLVWALPRTSHWTATALENAGFEIRDVVTHLFGTGFPKSRDISKDLDKMAGAKREVIGSVKITGHGKDNVKHGAQGRTKFEFDLLSKDPLSDSAKQWSGFGTALKPASEHWILVRKPLAERTVAANVLKHGTGGINVDGCRVGTESVESGRSGRTECESNAFGKGLKGLLSTDKTFVQGRFPANLVLSHNDDCEDTCSEGCAVKELDGQSGISKSSGGRIGNKPVDRESNLPFSGGFKKGDPGFGDSGGASRFFYCAKASKLDRGTDNKHPTVKSTKLMGYLLKLVTPPNGTVLDPFTGSGSTGVAALENGMRFVGIEQEKDYFETAKRRLAQ